MSSALLCSALALPCPALPCPALRCACSPLSGRPQARNGLPAVEMEEGSISARMTRGFCWELCSPLSQAGPPERSLVMVAFKSPVTSISYRIMFTAFYSLSPSCDPQFMNIFRDYCLGRARPSLASKARLSQLVPRGWGWSPETTELCSLRSTLFPRRAIRSL